MVLGRSWGGAYLQELGVPGRSWGLIMIGKAYGHGQAVAASTEALLDLIGKRLRASEERERGTG